MSQRSQHGVQPPRPARERGTRRAFMLAVLMHVLLALFLYHGMQWQNSMPAGAEAELWSSVPEMAVRRRSVVAPPPPVAATPAPLPKDDQAEIALQQKKRREQQAARAAQLLEQQRAAQLQAQQAEAEAQRLAAQKEKMAEQTRRQHAEKLKRQRAEQQELARQKQQEERIAETRAQAKAEKNAAEAQVKAAKKAAAAKTVAAKTQRDQERGGRLAQLQGLAGSGEGLAKEGTGRGSGGTAASPGYPDKVRRRVKPNIAFDESARATSLVTVVAVRCSPSGDVLSTSIVQKSGNSAWDEAVLRAIQKSSPLPPDIQGTTPSHIKITFRSTE